MHLVPERTRARPHAFPVYSSEVCTALRTIRRVQRAEESKLDPDQRIELGHALQLLGMCAFIESQIDESENPE